MQWWKIPENKSHEATKSTKDNLALDSIDKINASSSVRKVGIDRKAEEEEINNNSTHGEEENIYLISAAGNLQNNGSSLSKNTFFALRLLAYVVALTIFITAGWAQWKKETRNFSTLMGRTTPWPIWEMSLFMVYYEFSWGFALLLVSVLFYKGYGGWVLEFLGRPFWSPLARLTYGAYLVHLTLMNIVIGQYGALFRWTYAWQISMWLGFFVMAYSCSFLSWLLLEKPTMNLIALLIKRRK